MQPYFELSWAAAYEDGGLDIRSRALHESWLATLPCRVVRLEGDKPVAEHVVRLLTVMGG